nr:unnamed protein product [Digitaria exilis]
MQIEPRHPNPSLLPGLDSSGVPGRWRIPAGDLGPRDSVPAADSPPQTSQPTDGPLLLQILQRAAAMALHYPSSTPRLDLSLRDSPPPPNSAPLIYQLPPPPPPPAASVPLVKAKAFSAFSLVGGSIRALGEGSFLVVQLVGASSHAFRVAVAAPGSLIAIAAPGSLIAQWSQLVDRPDVRQREDNCMHGQHGTVENDGEDKGVRYVPERWQTESPPAAAHWCPDPWRRPDLEDDDAQDELHARTPRHGGSIEKRRAPPAATHCFPDAERWQTESQRTESHHEAPDPWRRPAARIWTGRRRTRTA